ncbi:hypothetical protein CDAR_450581 [Caerostris darwini]|uniref:Uncharacterized protein n=1 Tax=Caerostris darwini TaxID=1538125 RepID=A0AAV4P7X3_9ARAC|nr:hypothetical protein CDAR_450581 [Caerostris darwini]
MKYGMAIAVGNSIDSGGQCLFFRDHLGLCRGDVTSASGTVSSSVPPGGGCSEKRSAGGSPPAHAHHSLTAQHRSRHEESGLPET